MNIKDLSAEFPRETIHWRAQTLTRNGDKALALAYLDARDVMDRLDEVCGPENWQTEYVETARGRVLCKIGIRIDGEWVWKSDGAGDTAVEGEKGGISDSLKRAAVQWGIGRYLYRLDQVWAPCETYQKNGKPVWKAWKGSPWDYVRGAKSLQANSSIIGNLAVDTRQIANNPVTVEQIDSAATRDRIKAAIERCKTEADLAALWQHKATAAAMEKLSPPHQGELSKAYDDQAAKLRKDQEPDDAHEYS